MNNIDFEFKYDDDTNYEANFHRWYRANCIEREMFKEEKLSVSVARNIFSKQWGFKQIQDKVFVN